MPDATPSPLDSAEHSRAHEAVGRLRAVLADLGVPPDQIRQIVPVSDPRGRVLVRPGIVTPDAAELLLAHLETRETV